MKQNQQLPFHFYFSCRSWINQLSSMIYLFPLFVLTAKSLIPDSSHSKSPWFIRSFLYHSLFQVLQSALKIDLKTHSNSVQSTKFLGVTQHSITCFVRSSLILLVFNFDERTQRNYLFLFFLGQKFLGKILII